MKAVCSALVRAQRNFAPALKCATNPHFRSKYADLAQCVEAVVDALNAEGIFLMQRTAVREGGVVVSTVFVHESGEVMDAGELFVPAPKNDPQGYGMCLTYARRYSLMAACGHAPEDDDGNAASEAMRRQGAAPRAASAASGEIISAKFSEVQTIDDLRELWDSLSAAQQAQFKVAKDMAKKRIG